MLTALLVIAALNCGDYASSNGHGHDDAGWLMGLVGFAGCIWAIVHINGGG